MRLTERWKTTLRPWLCAGAVLISLLLRMVIPGLPPVAEFIWLGLLCALYVFCEPRALRPRREGFIAAAVMTVSTYWSFVVESHLLHTPLRKLLAVLVVFAGYLLLFSSLLGRDYRQRLDTRGGGRMGFGAALLLTLALATALLLPYRFYFPAGESGDTVNQWNQIHGLIPYNTVHAIGHTLFLRLLLSLWDSYAAVICFHLLGVLCLYLGCAAFFYRRGLKLGYIATVLLLGVIWMTRATPAWYYPWKDTPEALCLCLLMLLWESYREKGTLSLPRAVVVGLALAWCFLFRLNGVIALIVCGALWLISLLRRRLCRQALALVLAAAVSIAGVELYAERGLHVRHYENGFALQIFGSAIAAVVHDDALSEQELAEIDELLPVDWMREQYSKPREKRLLLWYKDGSPRIAENPELAVLNNEFVIRMGENKRGVIVLFLRLLPGHFRTVARDLLGSMATIWMQDSLFFPAQHIFWAVLVCCLALGLRLPWRDWLVFLPCVCNSFSIMISTATNEERYLLPTFMAAPFFVLYLAWHAGQAQRKENFDRVSKNV